MNSLDDLRAEVARVRADWAALHTRWTASLFDVPVRANGVYDFSPFSLQRFATGFDPKEVNHIGELIVDDRGRLQYLKTYRLSAAQCRRAYLLSRLAEADWNLADCAALLDCRHEELVSRLQNAGVSATFLHQHVLDAAVAWNPPTLNPLPDAGTSDVVPLSTASSTVSYPAPRRRDSSVAGA